MRRKVIVGLAAGLLLGLVSNAPAAAVPDATSTDDGYSGTVEIWSPGGPGNSSSNCGYQPAALTIASPQGEESMFGGVLHRLYSQFCGGELQATLWIPEFTPADVLALARDQLERTLPEPVPVMVWPDPDFDWAYAQVPIDYRAEPGDWTTFEDTATASTPIQTVSVTVRARPALLQFLSGDPAGAGGAACGGNDPVAVYLPAAPGACSYTYTNASSTAANGRSFNAAIEISWDIDYWSNTDPGFSGTLPAVTRQTIFPMEVAEVKTLGVAAPSR